MQGFNMGRYYPPSESAPTFNKSHARKLPHNQTVRFELPFAVWCLHCPPGSIVGQGVRFNAQKTKVGNYHSAPIWSFSMKHTACGGAWEIRTDPKGARYVCVEGCRERDYGEDKGEGEGELKGLTEEERVKRREDAFAGLEGRVGDKAREKGERERVEELYEGAEVWRDPYEVNAKLRRGMRGERRVWKKEERRKEGMQEKFSLGLEIVDETDADRRRAGIVEFGGADELERYKPLFGPDIKDADPAPPPKKLKAELLAEKNRKDLQQKLVGNTRAAVDPFVSREVGSKTRPDLGILKRKRDVEDALGAALPLANSGLPDPAPSMQKLAALVGYDSD